MLKSHALIQAADDPIAPEFAIPYKEIAQNDLCALIVTPAGGHLGWVSGPGAPLGKPLFTSETFFLTLCTYQDYPALAFPSPLKLCDTTPLSCDGFRWPRLS